MYAHWPGHLTNWLVCQTYFQRQGHANPEDMWLPYWPLEPYFSLFTIGLGTMLHTGASAKAAEAPGGTEVLPASGESLR